MLSLLLEMADDFVDFFDEPKECVTSKVSGSISLGNTLASSSTLLPIVEVPSEASSIGEDSVRSTRSENETSVTKSLSHTG